MRNLFHIIMEADGDLVEPFDAGAAANEIESEAEPPQQGNQSNDEPPPPGDDDRLAQRFDDSAESGYGEEEGSEEEGDSEGEPKEEKLSEKANAVLNQSLYQKLVTRNKEIEDTLENLQTITPVLPYDIISSNDLSINRLKAALVKGQSYAVDKFIDAKYGENLLFYQKLDALYVLLLNDINRNLKKVKL